jgi:hypothetical protein
LGNKRRRRIKKRRTGLKEEEELEDVVHIIRGREQKNRIKNIKKW